MTLEPGAQSQIVSGRVLVNGVEKAEAHEGDTLSFEITIQSLVSVPQFFMVEVMDYTTGQEYTEPYGLHNTWLLQPGETATANFVQTTPMPGRNMKFRFYSMHQTGVGGADAGWRTDDSSVVVDVNLATFTVTLTMVSSEGGYTTPAAGSHSYPTGADVSVEAFPNSGWRFDHWEFVSPDTPFGTDTRNPCQLMGGSMDRDVAVTPVFQYVSPPSTDWTLVAVALASLAGLGALAYWLWR